MTLQIVGHDHAMWLMKAGVYEALHVYGVRLQHRGLAATGLKISLGRSSCIMLLYPPHHVSSQNQEPENQHATKLHPKCIFGAVGTY